MTRGGTPLIEGRDYFFSFNANTDRIALIPVQGTFPLDIYEITIDNDAGSDLDDSFSGLTPVKTGVQDLAGNRIGANRLDGSTAFTIVLGPELVIDDVVIDPEGDVGDTTTARFTISLLGTGGVPIVPKGFI